MLSSLLAVASAATTEAWVPTLADAGSLGSSGFVAEDIDGDGQVDFVAPHELDDGRWQVVSQLSSDPDGLRTSIALDFTVGPSNWLTLNADDDAWNEVLGNLYDFDGGEFFVIDGEELAGDITQWSFLVSGDGNQGDRFGRWLEVGQIDGVGHEDMVFVSPMDNAVVVLTTDVPEPRWEVDHHAVVLGEGFQLANPIALVDDRDGDGLQEILISTDTGVAWLGSTSLRDTTVIERPDTVGDFTKAPLALERLPDLDGDGLDDAAWITADSMVWLSPENGVIRTWPVSPTGDVLGTEDGVWISDGGQAKYYSFATGGIQPFAVGGGTMGAALRRAGDLDQDGCEDVYASAPELQRVYLLQPDCGPTDTDEPDTADTAVDSADTAVDTDTAADTQGPDDTGEACVPEFGWSCSVGPGRGGLAGLLLLLLGLLARWSARD